MFRYLRRQIMHLEGAFPAPARWPIMTREGAAGAGSMLEPQSAIGDDELETGLRRLIIEALFSNATAALTTQGNRI